MNEYRVASIALALALIGFAGGYALADTPLGFTLFHLGGLGVLGLLASAAGAIAKKKGFSYWPAFLYDLSPAIVLGVIFAFLASPSGAEGRPAACGGSVSLVVALAILATWAFKRRRD